jgi:hypothetical protein
MELNSNKILPFIVGILLIINIQPYFTWSLMSEKILKVIIEVLTLGLFFLKMKRINRTDLNMLVSFFLILSMMAFFNGLNFFGFFPVVLLFVMPFVSYGFMRETYSYFFNTYALFTLLSLIVLFMLLLGISFPSIIIPPLNSLKNFDYIAYPFLVMPTGDGIIMINQFGRFFGPFDEPGVIGTVSLLILYIEKFNLKKWQNKILLVSGIISFSLFFYLASFIYAIYYVFVNRTRLIYKTFLVLGFAVFTFFSFENEFFSTYIWQRVEWDSNNSTIRGDNRADEDLKFYFESIKGTKIYYWGLGLYDTHLMTSFDGSAGFRNAILRHGFVSLMLYFLFFIVYAYQKIGKNNVLILFVVLFFITLYQRPGFLTIHYIYLFVIFIQFNSKKETTQKLKHYSLKN